MIDSWINCPHCGTNVTAILDRCTRCNGDLKHLADGSPNPGQENRFIKALQIGNVVDKAVFIVVFILFAGLILGSLL